jgi:hypothetical protein
MTNTQIKNKIKKIKNKIKKIKKLNQDRFEMIDCFDVVADLYGTVWQVAIIGRIQEGSVLTFIHSQSGEIEDCFFDNIQDLVDTMYNKLWVDPLAGNRE